MRQRLVHAGVPAEIHDELGMARLWCVSKRAACAWLDVPTEFLDSANELLRRWDAEPGGLPKPIRCPECHSLRVDYPQFTRKSLLTNLAMGLVAQLGFLEKYYYCEDCHFMWVKPGAKPPHERPHLAPYYFVEGVEEHKH